MGVCEQLEPREVFRFFEELCQIPHGSKNTKGISDYCMAFAKERGLEAHQDDWDNVVIKKPGTAGYEGARPVILQGHMDMVCEKEPGCERDLSKEGPSLCVDGDFVRADGTTLGADDGIALAYALAILDSDEIPHPPLEVVFTSDEEIGMVGAEHLDVSILEGRRLLNLDSEEEGTFLAGCAGGLRADCHVPISYESVEEGVCFTLRLHGLLGGHSGTEIQKERANAIIVLGRVLDELSRDYDLWLLGLSGGQMDNVIPRDAEATLVLDEMDADGFADAVAELEGTLRKEYRVSDPSISLALTRGETLSGDGTDARQALNTLSMVRLLVFLRSVPYGVVHRSAEMPDLVETSLNPGIVKLGEDLALSFSIRSSVSSRKYELADRLSLLAGFLGGRCSISGDYPAWEYNPDSELREGMRESYVALYGKEPKVETIHAGLECGIFSGKIPGLDCVSFGPDAFDIHTPKERLSISSTERVWKLILDFLKKAK